MSHCEINAHFGGKSPRKLFLAGNCETVEGTRKILAGNCAATTCGKLAVNFGGNQNARLRRVMINFLNLGYLSSINNINGIP